MNIVMNFENFYAERKYSQITEEFPDKTKFPLYYEAKRQQFIIDEGEMLFIPAGWWHFVFSEEPNTKTGLNVAFNFWYEPLPQWREGLSNEDRPKLKNHQVPTVQLTDILEDYEILIHRSKHKYFPPNSLQHKFPELKLETMTFNEFLMTRNPEYYILQTKCSKLEQYAPPFRTILAQSALWINFGNVYSLPHYDLQDNWLCQMQGRKRVILFPPEERRTLYPMNMYPLEFLNELNAQLGGDVFIRKNPFAISSKVCKHVIRLLPESTTRIEDFFNSYSKEKKPLLDFFIHQKCSLEKVQNPHHFKIVDARETEYEEPQLNVPCIFLWFMTNGTLEVRNFTFNVLSGQLFIFPSSFIYPWRVTNAVFVYPIFDRPNPGKSA